MTKAHASGLERVVWVRVSDAGDMLTRIAEVDGYTLTVWRAEPGSWRMSVRKSGMSDRADVALDRWASSVANAQRIVVQFVREGVAAGKVWSPERVMRFGTWTRVARFEHPAVFMRDLKPGRFVHGLGMVNSVSWIDDDRMRITWAHGGRVVSSTWNGSQAIAEVSAMVGGGV